MSCAKQSEEYRLIADAVRQKTAEIPLWDASAARRLEAEKHQACFFTGHRAIIGDGDKDAESFQRALGEWLENQVEAML